MKRIQWIVVCVLAVSLLWSFPAGAVKLTIFTMPHIGNPRWYNAGVQEFMKSHPGVEVEVVSGWLDKLWTMAAAGETPDLISWSSSELRKMVPLNMVANLSSFISQDKSFKLSEYLPASVEALKFRGQLYGLPRQWSVVGLLYNMTRFDERGVAYPDDTWDWDSMIKNGKKLTYSSKGDSVPDFYAFIDKFNNHHRQPIWVLEAGGQYWNSDYTKSLLDSPEAEKGLQYFVDLVNKYNIAPLPDGPFKDNDKAFFDGSIAMTHNTRFARPPRKDFRFGIAPVVKGPTGRQTLTIVDYVSVGATTKNPQLAWELTKYLCSDAGFQAGMDMEPQEGYYWGLSPFKGQMLKQLERDKDNGDFNWLSLLEISQPAPSFHPSGVNATLNLEPVARGQISLRALLSDSVKTWNQQIVEALAKGMKW